MNGVFVFKKSRSADGAVRSEVSKRKDLLARCQPNRRAQQGQILVMVMLLFSSWTSLNSYE